MLKHASICSTSRAQQALQQQQQQPPQSHDHHDQTDHSPAILLSPSPSISNSSGSMFKFAPNSNPASATNSPSRRHAATHQHQNQQHQQHQQHQPHQHNDQMIKIYAQTLSQDVEYITLHVNSSTKSEQIVKQLLKKFRLKHRDPNLFYLTLERWIRKDGVKFKSVMLLGDEACPLQLQQCCSNPPHNDIKFTLQTRAGVLVKIFCSDVVPDARYKCLSLSTQTTVEETIELMLHCLSIHSQKQQQQQQQQLNQQHHQRRHHHHQPEGQTPSRSVRNASTSTPITRQHATCLRLDAGSPSSANSTCSSASSASSSSCSSASSAASSTSSAASSSSSSSSGIVEGSDRELVGLNDSSPDSQFDSNSRASSVTSISSHQTTSSLADHFCLVIECSGSNYRRVLEPDMYLVDVYQSLLAEAEAELAGPGRLVELDAATRRALAASRGSTSSGRANEPPLDATGKTAAADGLNTSNGSTSSGNKSTDQWFIIKLARREDCKPELPPAIKFASPRQNANGPPPPPILPSLAAHFSHHSIVSTMSIEVPVQAGSGGTLQRLASQRRVPTPTPILATAPNSSSTFAQQQRQQQQQQQRQQQHRQLDASVTSAIHARTISTPALIRAAANQQLHQYHQQQSPPPLPPPRGESTARRLFEPMPPPPEHLILVATNRPTPPPLVPPLVKPRTRNLSNVSSTFGRPLAGGPSNSSSGSSNTMGTSVVANRRRYDPAQLAEDLSQLDMRPAEPATSELGDT